ncbi:hypothetical protein [Ectobacillus polymachus]
MARKYLNKERKVKSLRAYMHQVSKHPVKRSCTELTSVIVMETDRN